MLILRTLLLLLLVAGLAPATPARCPEAARRRDGVVQRVRGLDADRASRVRAAELDHRRSGTRTPQRPAAASPEPRRGLSRPGVERVADGLGLHDDAVRVLPRRPEPRDLVRHRRNDRPRTPESPAERERHHPGPRGGPAESAGPARRVRRDLQRTVEGDDARGDAADRAVPPVRRRAGASRSSRRGPTARSPSWLPRRSSTPLSPGAAASARSCAPSGGTSVGAPPASDPRRLDQVHPDG